MSVPQINGNYASHNIGPSNPVHTIDISGVPDGAWMVVSVMLAVSTTVTTPSGWTVIVSAVQSGTRTNYLFAKIRTSADGTSAMFTQGLNGNVSYGFLWGTGADSVDNWTVGPQWLRATGSVQSSGARYDNIAKSLTTTGPDNLVLAISHEATTAMIQQNELASFSPAGWSQSLWLPQHAADDRIETIWIGTKAITSAGVSGDVTVTYTSPQDNNGWTIQLAIPPSATVPPVTTTGIIGAATTFIGNTYTDFTINRPANAETGDYVVVVVRGQSSTTTVEPASAGFTRLGPAFVPSTNTYRLNGFYGRPITNVSIEPTSYTFTFTATNANTRLVATAVLVRGVNIDAPLAGYYDSYGGSAITSGVRVESYALADTPAFALFAAASEFVASSDHVPTTTPIGFTQVSAVTSSTNLTISRTALWLGSKEETNSSVSAASITWSGTLAGAAGEGIALRTADTPTPDPAGTGYTATDGAGEAVKIYHMTASGARTPSKVLPMLRGFASVADMLATPGFTWAHRGGSISYPEMSLHAYTQAVARGYGVLEISLARTSDGVWFGLHDQTTDRTSGGTYGNASSQTWAQIQAQQNVAGPGAPQPYLSWNELIAKYGHTHIIVADPKYALGSYRTEFLNMVNNDLGPTRAIIKYSGSGSGAANLSTAAKALGFETWGFFYAADASAGQGGNGSLQTWGPSWTLIGMEYGASQAIWDEALALGKPVIGHITPNQAAYDTAMAKGASGAQVSGVSVVNPVSWWKPSPIAAWEFSEGTGTVAADELGVRNLTVTGSSWVAGHNGFGVSAVGGAIIVPSKAGLETNHRTLMFWANWPDHGGNWRWGVGFNNTTLDTACWGIMPLNGLGELYCRIRIGGVNTNITIDNNPNAGAWHHYAITYDRKTFKAYRDGQLIGSVPITGVIEVSDEAVMHADGGTNVLDSVRMFNRALTQAQIVQQMNS